MSTQELEVIDHTDGDADQVFGTVIIHDTISGEPSIISYDWEIAETLREMAGPLPEEYKHLPEEYENAWKTGTDQGTLSGYEGALGARIEHFADFLKENSGVWEAPGGRIVKDEPTWTYPDDVISTAKNQTDTQSTRSKTMKTQDKPHPLEEVILNAMEAGDKKKYMKLLIELNKEGEHDVVYRILTRHWNRNKETYRTETTQ